MWLRTAASEEVKSCTTREFYQETGVEYTVRLQYASQKIANDVERRCQKGVERGWIDLKQKWLGAYYAKEIQEGQEAELVVFWIDERIGYGVVAARDLPARAYVTEYTGLLRKRRFFADRHNDYCFDYSIGDVQHSPYVIDARERGNASRFINHSSTPNVETAAVYLEGRIHIILYTLQAIPRGTELCYDYGDKYWKRRDDLIPFRAHAFSLPRSLMPAFRR